LKVGSLFTGIGGIDLGLERAGFEIAWQCELDSWCRQLLHQHWPSVPQYEDVTELRGGQLEPVEMLAGGFPCQDVSVAGRQAGLKEGTRSGLWSEYARLIGEIRPRYVLVENVPGLLVRGMDRVLGDLSELGYDAEWRTISAADVGAPHLRKRIWIVAYPAEQRLQGGSTGRQNVSGVADQSERCSETRVGDSVRGGCSGLDGRGPGTEPQNGCAQLPNADLSGLEGPRQGTLPRRQVAVGHCGSVGSVFGATKQPERSEWWVIEPNVGRVAHGVPKRVDRLKGLGNAVVPQIVEHIGHLIQSHSPHG
jgi:DNA (cytosine-5)-methyltransferase 1